MKKLAAVTLLFIAVLSLSALFIAEKKNVKDNNGEYLVFLNEIRYLSEKGDTQAVIDCTEKLDSIIRNDRSIQKNPYTDIVLMLCADIFILIIMALYIGIIIIRPFEKLTDFAERIAHGDFDIPLNYERTNYFGKFTWAFDSMRREIIKSRACEKEAIENNKTVIASLSHDIKTPTASIRAYAEALEMGMDSTPEKRRSYISMIIRKCDEASKLTDDLLLHSLSDLKKLKIVPEKIELCSFLCDTIKDISADEKTVSCQFPNEKIYVNADRFRTAQICENLINNAMKYAKSKVEITVTQDSKYACIHFRDFGSGISDEDMPFIFNKFYRGKNCGSENGSGLGLYIVRYIAQQSGGDITLKNHPDGLEASVSLPLTDQ